MSNTIRRITALLGATAVTSAALVGSAAALPTSPPIGDDGTVKIHRSTTSVDDPRNEPHVCGFYLVGFNFDPSQQVIWNIVGWAPTGDRTTTVLTGSLVLDATGHGRTTDLSLPDGHYKLFWNFIGEHGIAKHKVFWVQCHTPPTGPPPTTPPTPPTSTTPPIPTPVPSASTSVTPSQTPSEGAGQPGNSTSPPPAQVAQPVKEGGSLPFTGFAGRLLAALGAALVLSGAGAIVIAHRRRGRHASTSS